MRSSSSGDTAKENTNINHKKVISDLIYHTQRHTFVYGITRYILIRNTILNPTQRSLAQWSTKNVGGPRNYSWSVTETSYGLHQILLHHVLWLKFVHISYSYKLALVERSALINFVRQWDGLLSEPIRKLRIARFSLWLLPSPLLVSDSQRRILIVSSRK